MPEQYTVALKHYTTPHSLVKFMVLEFNLVPRSEIIRQMLKMPCKMQIKRVSYSQNIKLSRRN